METLAEYQLAVAADLASLQKRLEIFSGEQTPATHALIERYKDEYSRKNSEACMPIWNPLRRLLATEGQGEHHYSSLWKAAVLRHHVRVHGISDLSFSEIARNWHITRTVVLLGEPTPVTTRVWGSKNPSALSRLTLNIGLLGEQHLSYLQSAGGFNLAILNPVPGDSTSLSRPVTQTEARLYLKAWENFKAQG